MTHCLNSRLQIDDLDTTEEERELASNSLLSSYHIKLSKDLDCLKPKKPEDVYKGISEETLEKIDSAVLNLADSFVNSLVNMGTSKDTLMEAEEGPQWITKVQSRGIMSTVAGLGLIHLWNFEECCEAVSEYVELEDGYAKAGALLAWGLCNSGIWDENDPAKALLEDNLGSSVAAVQVGAAMGLGIAYAGSERDDLNEGLTELIIDENLEVEVSANAALALSMIHVSGCNDEVIQLVYMPMLEFEDSKLNAKEARFFPLALALNFFGRQADIETILESLDCIEHRVGAQAKLLVEIAAYAGSGNMLKIQEMFDRAKKHSSEKDEVYLQSLALIGMTLISLGEKMAVKMLIRNIHHILQYCEKELKAVAPIMIALLGVLDPSIQNTDLLYKLCFSEDKETGFRAIFGLGLLAAGTNNARVATLLRNLFDYYHKENDYTYMIKIALGLVYAGKGLVSMNPYYSNDFLFSKTGFASLMIIAVTMLDMQHSILEANHYLIYYLGLAFYPKMLFCLDEDLKELDVNVRVGQAVDVVAQVGKPRKITGFQTHKAPVLINNGECAELAGEEWIPVGDVVLENIVILKKNPEYVKEEVVSARKKTSGYF